MLNDLNQLALSLQQKYKEEFNSNEIILSDNFKEAYGSYLRNNSQDIAYTKYTATITSAGNLKMYIPNQWFRAAAFMCPYITELIRYKSMAENVVTPYKTSGKDKKQYFTEMKNTEDQEAIEEFESWASEYLEENSDDLENIETEVQYLTSFVTDYEWWFGSKTIDRGDYYVSPVLSLLGVVNASQSYIADISYNLASNHTLTSVAEDMLDAAVDNEETLVPEFEFDMGMEVLRKKGGINEIVYGAPGTGKSRYLADKYGQPPLTRRVVFHSEYSYYDFVGVYKPVPVYKDTEDSFKTNDGEVFVKGEPYIDYRFIPGPFIQVLVEAWLDPERMHTLLIEEINRADSAAVFGEVFQLLDRDIDGSSEYTFQPSEDLKAYLNSIEGLQIYLKNGVAIPSNMNIVATMNSADQGVKPMDSAFKRRWNFHYVRINIKGAVHEKAEIQYAGRKVYWGSLVDLINRKLSGGTLRLEEDKLIGPYFIKPDEVGKKRAIDKLLLYLWDDVLRHSRDSFFNSNIGSFADLSEKFDTEDVLDLMQIPENIEYLEVKVGIVTTEEEDEEIEDVEESENV
ncbi:AAA family ATPase [Anaerocolumna sp. MB42-C2]|uniref:AAA family ATPase n=1 Tax=Anaerocolumna sp. MB42-C2 TaxID=3070997 RepID=UPI0027E01537|nr:AAA family ATPase [Anaerocolumna sp. MB42-C2]WMJ86728.1 AAA family ATPase [Anaerocolumna sp. MB42-C2]